MAGGHAWWGMAGMCMVGACVAGGTCVAGEMAPAADPTGMHSCFHKTIQQTALVSMTSN